jgi:hypothetical protein
MAGLLALFTAAFPGIINETIPAGLLPEISKSLGISESLAGQTVTVYAVATALTAIPLNAALKTGGAGPYSFLPWSPTRWRTPARDPSAESTARPVRERNREVVHESHGVQSNRRREAILPVLKSIEIRAGINFSHDKFESA